MRRAAVRALAAAVMAASALASGATTAQSRAPSWTTAAAGAADRFPDARYLRGAGAAPLQGDPAAARAAADAAAFAEIARQLEASVASAVRSRTEERTDAFSREYSAETTIRTALSLSGLTVVDRWEDAAGGRVHSLAVLDRAAAVARLRTDLAGARAEEQGALAPLREAAGPVDVSPLFACLDRSFRAAERADRAGRLLAALGAPDTVPDAPAPGATARAVVASMRLTKLGGDEQRIAYNRPASEPLRGRLVFTRPGGGDVPVRGARISLDADPWLELDAPASTDDDGIVVAAVRAMREEGGAEQRARFTMNWTRELPRDSSAALWKTLARVHRIEATYALRHRPALAGRRIDVRVDGLAATERELVLAAVRAAVDSMGGAVVAGAADRVLVSVTAGAPESSAAGMVVTLSARVSPPRGVVATASRRGLGGSVAEARGRAVRGLGSEVASAIAAALQRPE